MMESPMADKLHQQRRTACFAREKQESYKHPRSFKFVDSSMIITNINMQTGYAMSQGTNGLRPAVKTKHGL